MGRQNLIPTSRPTLEELVSVFKAEFQSFPVGDSDFPVIWIDTKSDAPRQGLTHRALDRFHYLDTGGSSS